MSKVLYLHQTLTDCVFYINVYILECLHAKYDCWLWKVSLVFYCLSLIKGFVALCFF